MTDKEAKKLKIGNRVVIWPRTPDAAEGEVVEIGYNAFKTKYDDGIVGFVHFNDAQDFERVPA